MGDLHYWNRSNFEGLVSLSRSLRMDQRLVPLANYCDLREKGLRRQAFAELDSFLEQIQTLDVPIQREIAVRILDIHWTVPQAHQFLTEPLRKQFLEPVLEKWHVSDPGNGLPLRHLALLRSDYELLKEAIRLNPEDYQVRASLARILVKFVEHATHHLVEGKFIGNEEDASTAIADVVNLLKDIPASDSSRSWQEEATGLASLLSDWDEYRREPQGTFPEWCRKRNRNHRWWSIVYYDG